MPLAAATVDFVPATPLLGPVEDERALPRGRVPLIAAVERAAMQLGLMFAGAVALAAASSTPPNGRPVAATAPPPAARAAGFVTRTFATTRFSPANVDTGKRLDSGRQWYLWHLFGCDTKPDQVVLPGDGTAQVFGPCGPNGALMSAMAKPGAPGGWVGTMFGGGGYFEAEIAYDAGAVDLARGWLSWWAMSGEHLFQLRPQMLWAGHPDPFYEHFIEVDTFEALRPRALYPDSYAAAVHDWYGHYKQTCPMRFCAVDTPFRGNTATGPPGTDWSAWHRVAVRWIPATAARQGELSFYLDDARVGPVVRYDRYTDQPPPVPRQGGWAFSIVDRQHLVLIFGAGPATPIRVRSVRVWQTDAKENLVR